MRAMSKKELPADRVGKVADFAAAIRLVGETTRKPRPEPDELFRHSADALLENLHGLEQFILFPAQLSIYEERFQFTMRQLPRHEGEGVGEYDKRIWEAVASGYVPPVVNNVIILTPIIWQTIEQEFARFFDDDAIRYFYRAMLIQAWTVFESLAEDVWIDAVNARPSRLGSLKGQPRGKYSNESKRAGIEQGHAKMTRKAFRLESWSDTVLMSERKWGTFYRASGRCRFDLFQTYGLPIISRLMCMLTQSSNFWIRQDFSMRPPSEMCSFTRAVLWTRNLPSKRCWCRIFLC